MPHASRLHFARTLGVLTSLVWVMVAPVSSGIGAYAPAPGWQRLAYPRLDVPGTDREQMTVMVSSGSADDRPQLRVDLQWSAMATPPLPVSLADASSIAISLHTEGKVTRASGKPDWIGIGNAGGITYSLMATFPWSRNALDDAWIEAVVAGRTFWLALPYGFARNPTDPEVDAPTRGAPTLPPTMALKDNDVLVPWLHARYELGRTQNGGVLSLELSNPFDAAADVVLYHSPQMQVGPRQIFWTLDTPRTTVEVQAAGLAARVAVGTARRLLAEGLERRDTFSFQRAGSSNGRVWGSVIVGVDAERFTRRVPSSLFKYVHGIVDPQNSRWLRVPRER